MIVELNSGKCIECCYIKRVVVGSGFTETSIYELRDDSDNTVSKVNPTWVSSVKEGRI